MLPVADADPLSTPFATVASGRSTLRFFRADCVELLGALPPQSVSAIVTSPPYNLGIDYRTYDDTMPRDEYLEWTGDWIQAAARVLAPDGSLFLNVGAKPTDPWTAMDVAQAARRHLQLQNTIHWIKSIAIDQDAAGAGGGPRPRPRGRPLQADQQRALPERLPRVHLPLHAGRADAARSPGDRRALPGRQQHRALADRRQQPALPRQHLVHPLRHDPEPRQRTGRTRRPSRRACRSTACGCTGSSRCNWSWIRSSGWAARRSRARKLGADFVGVEIDEHYLNQAVTRTREFIANPSLNLEP